MNLGKIDWGAFRKYTSPQAIKDLDRFLDAIPLNVGYNALIAAGLAWVLGGSAVFFASMETEKVSKLHGNLMEVQALQPPVPVLKYIPVSQQVIQVLAKKITETYKGVAITVNNDGMVTLSAPDTDYFPQFLAAISYLQRGGRNWKVKINTICVGRDCLGSKLSASLGIDMVRFGDPEKKKED
ncbi:MAG: hypothetical protein KAI76_02855 [Alphaproteobacteria bacterium]|nr:hypothetical protein [Alphaproteobacteria bacterium]